MDYICVWVKNNVEIGTSGRKGCGGRDGIESEE